LENIVIDKFNKCKLIDFGFSEVLPRPSNAETKYCGTPYYLPPEFVTKEKLDGKFCLFYIN
jgi:serine/threonine protein kinase